ncbi:MAG: hypothetical protein R3C61_10525 [Bacteroidia bacterium]
MKIDRFEDVSLLILDKEGYTKFQSFIQNPSNLKTERIIKEMLDNLSNTDHTWTEFEKEEARLTRNEIGNKWVDLVSYSLMGDPNEGGYMELVTHDYLAFTSSLILKNHWYMSPGFYFSRSLLNFLLDKIPLLYKHIYKPGYFPTFEEIPIEEMPFDLRIFPKEIGKSIMLLEPEKDIEQLAFLQAAIADYLKDRNIILFKHYS